MDQKSIKEFFNLKRNQLPSVLKRAEEPVNSNDKTAELKATVIENYLSIKKKQLEVTSSNKNVAQLSTEEKLQVSADNNFCKKLDFTTTQPSKVSSGQKINFQAVSRSSFNNVVKRNSLLKNYGFKVKSDVIKESCTISDVTIKDVIKSPQDPQETNGKKTTEEELPRTSSSKRRRSSSETSKYESSSKVVVSKPDDAMMTSVLVEKIAVEEKEKRSSLPQKLQFVKGLPFPIKYQSLEKQFGLLDYFVSISWNKEKKATSWKVVDKCMKKSKICNFTKRQLSQINYLFPKAYKIEIKKTDDWKKETLLHISPLNISGNMESKLMVNRRVFFKKKLLSQLHIHHKTFLSNLSTKDFKEVQIETVTSWHPLFDINQVDDIPISNLPCLHNDQLVKKLQPNFKNKFPSLTSLTKTKEKNEENKNKQQEEPQKEDKKCPAGLEGVSSRLLEKIRAKEMQRFKKEMIRNKSEDEKLEKLRKLPQVAKILNTLFASERKQTLKMEFVCSKLSTAINQNSMSAESLLRLFCDDVTMKWMTINVWGTNTFIKIDRTKPISDVIRSLHQRIRRFETS